MPPKKETTKKPAASKRTITRRKKQPTTITEEMIATRAYFLHLETGADPIENWFRAERELITA
jgi:hypothetical protein